MATRHHARMRLQCVLAGWWPVVANVMPRFLFIPFSNLFNQSTCSSVSGTFNSRAFRYFFNHLICL